MTWWMDSLLFLNQKEVLCAFSWPCSRRGNVQRLEATALEGVWFTNFMGWKQDRFSQKIHSIVGPQRGLMRLIFQHMVCAVSEAIAFSYSSWVGWVDYQAMLDLCQAQLCGFLPRDIMALCAVLFFRKGSPSNHCTCTFISIGNSTTWGWLGLEKILAQTRTVSSFQYLLKSVFCN